MAFENLKIQIAMLLEGSHDRPEDMHEAYQKVMQEIGEMRSFGLPIPADLLELERSLEEKFAEDTPVQE